MVIRSRYICLCILALCTLSSWRLSAQDTSGKSRLILSLSGGYASLSGTLAATDMQPYGFAQNGGFASVCGFYAIHGAWGIAADVIFQGHTYDAGTAAAQILKRDTRAAAAKVEAGGYRMLTAAIGPGYEINVWSSFRIRIAASLGIATVFTPHITEDIKTAPYTLVTYKSGRASAFYAGCAFRPTWYLVPGLGLGLVFSGGYANPEIWGEQIYSLKYSTLRTGLELTLRL